MVYYAMQQDDRLRHCAVIQNLSTIKNYKDALNGFPEKLRPVSVAFVSSTSNNLYPGILDRQLLMVNDEMKKLFEIFRPDTEYRVCCLLDRPENTQHYYHIPILKTHGSRERDGVIYLSGLPAPNEHVLRIGYKQNDCLLVSQVLAEAVFRRHIHGIRLRKTVVE